MIYPSKKQPSKKDVKFVFESAATEENEGFEEENKGFAGMSADEYIGSLGLTRSEELADEENAYGDFFKDPKIMSSFTEHFDLADRQTRTKIMNLNEADQNAVLTALTSKLYDHIVAKVDDIDYGEIPSTKGDITKLSNYDKLYECITILENILAEYKQDATPIKVIGEAIANISTRKELFERAFKFDVELPIIMYNNTVLSIINGVSFMIATCIEFIKTPTNESFDIVLDKVAYNKTKNNMIYRNLKKFNKTCSNGDFDKAMNHIITARVKGYNEAAVVGTVIGGAAVVLTILVSIIPILREMVFFFYYSRMRVSEFFDVQADLLQMNAHNLEINDANTTEDKKERILSKQLKIVELFRKISNKISYTNKKAEVDTEKEIDSDSKKLKIDSDNNISDVDSNYVSALF